MEHTRPEMILLAAEKFAGQFIQEDLLVAAWKVFPEAFGIKGIEPSLPCTNTCIAALVGKFGPLKRGWIERIAPKRCVVTPLGRAELDWLHGRANGTVAPKAKVSKRALPEGLDADLRRLLVSRAWDKWTESRKDDLTFADASEWWLLKGSDGLIDPVGMVEFNLNYADAAMQGESVTMLSGRVLTPMDVADLRNLDAELRKRFAAHLRRMQNHGKTPCIPPG